MIRRPRAARERRTSVGVCRRGAMSDGIEHITGLVIGGPASDHLAIQVLGRTSRIWRDVTNRPVAPVRRPFRSVDEPPRTA